MEVSEAKPFDSVHTALSLFEKRDCQNSCNSSENGDDHRKEKEVDFLLKELANRKLQLEINESASKQTILELEVYRRLVDDLSIKLKNSDSEIDRYKEECQQAQTRIAQLQSENKAQAKLLFESGEVIDEFKTLKELFLTRAEDAAAEESRIIAEELSEKSLAQNTAVDESILSSVANVIQVHYYRSELTQAKELSHKVSQLESNLALIEAEKKKMQEELACERDKVNYLYCQIEAFSAKMQAMQHEMSEIMSRELELELKIATREADLQESRSRIAAESTEAKRKEDDILKGELEAANSEISDLRLNLEEATKRAELAEKAKAAVEHQLRKWREEQQLRRTSADSSVRKDGCGGKRSICIPPLNKSNARAAEANGGTRSPVFEKTGHVPLAKVLNLKL